MDYEERRLYIIIIDLQFFPRMTVNFLLLEHYTYLYKL